MVGLGNKERAEGLVMPARRKPSGKWFYRKWVTLPDGQRKRISGTPETNTKKAAEAAERRHVHRLMHPELAVAEKPIAEAPTFDDYADTYVANKVGKPNDIEATKQILSAYLRDWFGPMTLDLIRQADIDAFKVAMLKTRRPKTVNNITSVLARILRYAARNQVIAPVSLEFAISTQEAEVRAVPVEDVEKLLAACSDTRYRAAILLAFEAGLRIGEIRGLQWGDVNELHRELSVVRAFDRFGNLGDTKGRRKRVVPMTDRLWSELDALPRRSEWCVTRLRDGDPLSYWATRDAIVELYDTAGVDRPSQPWHCIRHSFGTELADANVPPHVIQELMGHESFATTLRYIDTKREAKRAAVSKTFGHHMGTSRAEEKAKPRKT